MLPAVYSPIIEPVHDSLEDGTSQLNLGSVGSTPWECGVLNAYPLLLVQIGPPREAVLGGSCGEA